MVLLPVFHPIFIRFSWVFHEFLILKEGFIQIFIHFSLLYRLLCQLFLDCVFPNVVLTCFSFLCQKHSVIKIIIDTNWSAFQFEILIQLCFCFILYIYYYIEHILSVYWACIERILSVYCAYIKCIFNRASTKKNIISFVQCLIIFIIQLYLILYFVPIILPLRFKINWFLSSFKYSMTLSFLT